MAWQEHSIEEQKLFLGLMESCGVCFPCGTASQGETLYVAPDLLPVSAVRAALRLEGGAPSTVLAAGVSVLSPGSHSGPDERDRPPGGEPPSTGSTASGSRTAGGTPSS